MGHKEKCDKVIELIDQFMTGIEGVYPKEDIDPHLFIRFQTICTLIDSALKKTYSGKRMQTIIDGIKQQEGAIVDECLKILETENLKSISQKQEKIIH